MKFLAKRTPKPNNDAGFTIVELMVASMVFSSILLIITFGVLQFTHTYYRGLAATNTQNATRTVVDTVSQALQFSGYPYQAVPPNNHPTPPNPPTPEGAYCLGGNQYNYMLSQQLSDTPTGTQTARALYVTPQVGGTGCVPIDPVTAAASSTTKELLSPRMRLVRFDITNPGGGDIYNVDIRVAYGDDDLLCSPQAADNDCASTLPADHATNLLNNDLVCRATTGSQYCAVAELSTTVEKRVQ